jgi:hypothetical protein
MMEEILQPEEPIVTEVEEAPEEDSGLLTQKKIYENIQNGVEWVKSGMSDTKGIRWDRWKKNKEYLNCQWKGSAKKDVTVNTIFSNYRVKLPNLYFKNPTITAKPSKPLFAMDSNGQKIVDEQGKPIMVDTYASAKLFSVKINNELKRLKFKKIIKKCIGDVLCPYGVCYAKVGFSKLNVGQNEDTPESSDYDVWVSRVDPRNLIFDPFAEDLDSARFVAERIKLTKKEAKAMGFKIPKKYSCSLPDFYKDKQSKNVDEDDLVLIWEYYDQQEKRIYWLLDNGDQNSNHASSSKTVYDLSFEEKSDDWIKEPVENDAPFEGSCYSSFTFNDDNDDIIGLSDVEPVEDQALAINRGMSKMQNHIDNYGTMTVVEEGAINPDMAEALKEDTHGLFLFHKQGRPAPSVTSTPPLGQDNFNIDNLHKFNMQTTLGITDYQKGASIARTATEASYMQGALAVRIEDNKESIKEFVVDIVRKLGCLLQKYGKEEDYFDLSTEDLNDEFTEQLKEQYGFNQKLPFLKLNRSQYQGEYVYDFNVDDMVMVPKEVQLQQWMQFFGLVTGNEFAMKEAKKEGISFGKVFKKIAELGGINIDEIKSGGPTQSSAIKENMMFESGMEVPEPHEKDQDDEHILIHGQVAEKLNKQIQGLSQALQQIDMIEQQGKELAAIEQQKSALVGGGENPGQLASPLGQTETPQAPQPNPQIEEQKMQMRDQLQQASLVLKRVTLHMQAHAERSGESQGSGMPMGGGQSSGQPRQNTPPNGATQAVNMRAQAQQAQMR